MVPYTPPYNWFQNGWFRENHVAETAHCSNHPCGQPRPNKLEAVVKHVVFVCNQMHLDSLYPMCKPNSRVSVAHSLGSLSRFPEQSFHFLLELDVGLALRLHIFVARALYLLVAMTLCPEHIYFFAGANENMWIYQSCSEYVNIAYLRASFMPPIPLRRMVVEACG